MMVKAKLRRAIRRGELTEAERVLRAGTDPEGTQDRDLTAPAMSSFRFERTFALSEDRYVALWSGLPLRSRGVLVFLALFLGLSVACLFWRYTVALGIVLLVLWLLIFFVTWLHGLARGLGYRLSKHLHETTTYGASEEAFWFRSPTVEGRARWRRLWKWRETAGLLVLRARGLGPVYLPVEGLKSEGLYDRVVELAGKHGRHAWVCGMPPPRDRLPRRARKAPPAARH